MLRRWNCTLSIVSARPIVVTVGLTCVSLLMGSVLRVRTVSALLFPSTAPPGAFSLLSMVCAWSNYCVGGCNVVIFKLCLPFTFLTWRCSVKKSFLFLLSPLMVITMHSWILFVFNSLCCNSLLLLTFFVLMRAYIWPLAATFRLAPISFWHISISLWILFSFWTTIYSMLPLYFSCLWLGISHFLKSLGFILMEKCRLETRI